jgi:hypothetical protein
MIFSLLTAFSKFCRLYTKKYSIDMKPWGYFCHKYVGLTLLFFLHNIN